MGWDFFLDMKHMAAVQNPLCTVFGVTPHFIFSPQVRECPGAKMNLIINADKFVVLHYALHNGSMRCVPGVHKVGRYYLRAHRRGEYVQLLGGDAN